MWLCLPIGRFQSGDTCRIAAAKAWWWSWRATWPNSRRRIFITRWESGEQPVVPLTSAVDTWRVYGILKILLVPTCQMHQGERAGTLWWPISYTHTSKLAQCMSVRGVTWFPVGCLTSRSSSPTYSCKTELCQSDTGPLFCCHKRSQSCIPE